MSASECSGVFYSDAIPELTVLLVVIFISFFIYADIIFRNVLLQSCN